MHDLDGQLRSYIDAVAEQITDAGDTSRRAGPADHHAVVVAPDLNEGDLTTEIPRGPDQSDAAGARRRWVGAMAGLAAMVLLIVGVVVLPDRDGDVVTDSVVSPTVATPTAPTTVTQPPSRPTVSDSVGNEWTPVPGDDAVFTAHMQSVARGGPGLVAVGTDESDEESSAVVWTSVDGVSWSRVPHDEVVFGGGGMESVAVGGPGLVAVGSVWSEGDDEADAAVWTSVDGVSWSRVPHDEAVFGDGAVIGSVTVGGPGLVAVGGSGSHDNGSAAIWTSGDGISWVRVPHDEAVFGGVGAQYASAVTVGGPGLVAVGWDFFGSSDAAVWTSVDGITWTRVHHDEGVFGGRSHQGMFGVVADGSTLVAVGDDRSRNREDGELAVWTSVDGITWSRGVPGETVFDGGPMLSVAAGGPGLVAVGNESVWVARPDE